MTNIEAAQRIVARAREAGVDEFCVCAGSRNSPLLYVLGSSSDVRLFSFVDERSAAFFALGRIKQHARPCAVVTTSGTAAAELLPAAIEAHYSGLPLLLITADRPARYHGTGAPQAIEQIGLFGVYADTSFDEWDGARPLHLNIEFDEPLIDAPVTPTVREGPGRAGASEPQFPRRPPPRPLAHARGDKSLILIGGLAPPDRPPVREWALRTNAAVYAEPLSGLREDPALAPLRITNERMLARGGFDRVIRVGNVPTLRFWRDLDEKLRDLPLVSYSRLPFAGLSRGEVHSLDELPDVPGSVDLTEDRAQAERFAAILDDEPRSELAMIRALSRELPENARIYLGNSLPIREWDLAATREPRGFDYEANRGANGIDGQLSTFFGWCKPGAENVCVVGDLTALYDLNAPWIVPQLDASFRIVIVNNGGGRIFSRVASLKPMNAATRERIIENAHGLRFDHWAAMWGIEDRVTELRPDPDATRRVWERYDALW